jgi:hypothetical protein
MIGRRLAGLLIVLAAALLGTPAAACSMAEGYRIPSNFELVRQAELIVLARVVSGATDLDSRDTWVTLEPVRVLKGSLPAEPLRVLGVISLNGQPVPSMPTPLGPSHFSAGMGACIRLLYPQGGLVLALFERTPEGLRPMWAAWARLAEDVEGPEGIWVRAAETYIAVQQSVADGDLRAAAERRMAALRAQAGDLAAEAIAEDLQHYLDATAPGGPVRRDAPAWLWLDTPEATGALLAGAGGQNGIGLRCERGGAALRIDRFGAEGTPQLTLLAGGQRFAAEGESRTTLPDGTRSVTGTVAFTPTLAGAMRTSPAPAGVEAAGSAPVTAAPGDVLQKLALRCAALLTPGTAAVPAR